VTNPNDIKVRPKLSFEVLTSSTPIHYLSRPFLAFSYAVPKYELRRLDTLVSISTTTR